MASATLMVLLLIPLATLARAQTNITLGSSLTADDRNSSWKSPSGDFAFGFQMIGNEGFLLSIWFDKIPEKTVIWSGNRDSLAPQGSRVELSSDGRLILIDPNSNEIWRPSTAVDGVVVSHASMLDTGNFVLEDDAGSNLWESFSEPTDTIVPTQVLGRGGEIASRLSATNYSRGRFKLSMEANGNLTMFTLPAIYGSNRYWESNTQGSGYQLIFNQTGQIYLIGMNGTILDTIMSGMVSNADHYQRAVMDNDGVFRQYVYPKNASFSRGRASGWSMISSPVPPNICTTMRQSIGDGACGENSYCLLGDDQRPRCECPVQYSYVDPSNEMNGCKPDFLPQSCDKGAEESNLFTFSPMINTDWPGSNYMRYDNQTEDFCRQVCMDDCFCYVAIFREDTCWMKRMPLSNGQVDASIGGTALIKVRTDVSNSNIPLGGPKKQDDRTLIIIASTVLSISAALILIILTFLAWFKHNNGKKAKNLQPNSVGRFTRMQSFKYEELRESTGGFKEELGRGALGVVYKGVLTSDERSVVAVKMLEKVTADGDREFKTEMNTIGRTNHKNLVELIGFCNEGQNRLLVYEFMPNGSLADFLFGGSRPSWVKRIEIAYGVARGLLYLHEESSKQIVHCDIKPQNILLDECLTAKISDFGLAKLLMANQTRTTTAVRGTQGYLAPEWFRNMPISSKVDVYSFGIVLLELICCRRNCEYELNDEAPKILSDWVYDCYHQGMLNVIVEGDEEALKDMKRVQRFVMIAMWCIQEEPSLRPSMKKVSQMLEGAVEVSVPPTGFISSI